MGRKAIPLLLMWGVLYCSTVYCNIIRVSTTGNDGSTGDSWSSSKRSIRAAIAVARAGDEVWVAAGTYEENLGLPNGVALYGGFAGGETARAQRDWRANETRIDGGRSGSVISVGHSPSSNTRIDGFTIYNGLAPNGAGIFYRTNYAYETNSHLAIENNRLVGNEAYEKSLGDGEGGAVYAFDATVSASISIRNNTISGNSATRSGIYVKQVFGDIMYNSVESNRSTGALALSAGWSSIANNVFAGNTSFAIRLTDAASPSVVNNTIISNGGGIAMNDRAAPLIANNIVWGNSVGIYAFWYAGRPSLRNNCVNPGAYSDDDTVYLAPGVTDMFLDPQLDGSRLTATSPCINAGDDTAALGLQDIDGDPRIYGVHADIGADEYIPEPSSLLTLLAGLGSVGCLVRRRRR